MNDIPRFNRLVEELEKKGMNQSDLARAMGVSRSRISNIVCGYYITDGGYYCSPRIRKQIIKILPKMKHEDFKLKGKDNE